MSFAPGATVWTSDRRHLTLGKLIKSGGAGSVYLLGDSAQQVAKIYHPGSDLGNYERKVAAMLRLSPELPDINEDGHRYVQIAWPQSSLQDDHGRFIGFLMPVLDIKATIELEYMMQERQARAAGLPTGLGAKVTLAANLSAVISELHRHGHFVVDLKPVNLRFYRQSLYLAMLDCDGFSIQGSNERFPALQFTPDYLAPEFQTAGLSPADGEPQDRFALAVIIFQLLNFGIHPFTGRPSSDTVPTDIPGRIARRCYAYGIKANPLIAPSPVSGHACLPMELRLLFDRAFQGSPQARPAASEWSVALQAYAQKSSNRLVACSKNAAHQCFAGQPCAACARESLLASTRKANQAQDLAAGVVIGRQLGWNTVAPSPRSPPPQAWQRTWRATPTTPPVTYTPPARTPFTPPGHPISIGFIFRALVILFVLVSKLCSHPTRTASTYSEPQSSPPPSLPISVPRAPESYYLQDSANPNSRACYLPTGRALDDAAKMASVAADGMTAGERTHVELAFSNLRRYATGTGSQAEALPDSFRSEFELFALRSDFDDDLTRGALVGHLEDYMHEHPRSAEAAYERGWLAISAREPAVAIESFLCSIEIDPSLPQTWYGLAVAGENYRTGYLGMAAMLMPDERTAEKIRGQFGARLLDRAYLDQRDFLNSEVFGQQLAAQMRAQGLEITARNSIRAKPKRNNQR